MITSQPLFTVATITYNSGKWVRQAIESVLASSFIDFEYIISDDCSTDDSWEIIQQYNDPRIKALKNEKNIGEYPNRNKVLNEAKGKYLLFVDGDDVLFKNTLRNLSEYTESFPDAEMIWGVQPSNIDFAIMPYLFNPKDLTRLIYGTSIPLAIIGFAETIFRIKELTSAGGFSERYSIGDVYIKKKLALSCKTLFVPMGFVFWRRSTTQTSSKINISYKNFIEGFLIDCEIMKEYNYEQKDVLLKNIRASFMRRLIKNTIFKGRLLSFIKIYKEACLNTSDLFLIFKRYSYKYRPVESNEKPLFNSYNFLK